MIDWLVGSGRTRHFMSTRSGLSYRLVAAEEDGVMRSIQPMASADVRINGGFFVFRDKIFHDLHPKEHILDEAARLARAGRLLVYSYDGFWAGMEKVKDKQELDALVASGPVPRQARQRARAAG